MPAKKPVAPKPKSSKTYLAAVDAALAKRFGKTSVIDLGKSAAASRVTDVIPSGIEVIDRYLLPCGGFAAGRIFEVAGAENVGKSSLLAQVFASAQRDGADTYLVDPELAFDEGRAVDPFGVDLKRLRMLRPTCLEDLLEMLKVVLAARPPAAPPVLIGWDAVASTKTKAGSEAEAGQRRPGDFAAIMSDQLPIMVELLVKHRGVLLALNQLRANIGVRFGDKETTPGGRALPFYASGRIRLLGGKAVKDAKGNHIAKVITALMVKTRFSPPFRKARIRLDYATGFNNGWSTLEHAKTSGVLSGQARGAEALLEARRKLGWLDAPPDAAPPPETVEDLLDQPEDSVEAREEEE